MINPFFLCPRWWWQCFWSVWGRKWMEGWIVFGEVNVEYHFSGWWHWWKNKSKRSRRCRISYHSQACVSSQVKEHETSNKKNGTSFTHCHHHRIQKPSDVTCFFYDNIKGIEGAFAGSTRSLPLPYQIIALMVSQQRIYYGSQRSSEREIN